MRAMELNIVDRKGLIREAYRIDGITLGECRSIFLDWALSLPTGVDAKAAISQLLEIYETDAAHPMTVVLNEGLQAAPKPARRGGRSARVADARTS